MTDSSYTISCRKDGFALTELIVVIGLIAILLAVSIPAYNSWQKKYAIEKQTQEIHTDISGLQLRAIATKMEHRAFFNEKNYLFKRYTSSGDDGNSPSSTVASRGVPYSIQVVSFGATASNQTISYNSQGITNDWTTLVIGPNDSNPSYNCLSISWARINMGKMNAGTCEFK